MVVQIHSYLTVTKMELSTPLCIVGIVVFGVPLVYIVQNAINGIKFAGTNDPRINTRWISVIMAIVNVIVCLVILAVLFILVIELISKLGKPSVVSSSGAGADVDDGADAGAGAAAAAAAGAEAEAEAGAGAEAGAEADAGADADAGELDRSLPIRIERSRVVPTDAIVIQREGDLFTVDSTAAAKFRKAIKELDTATLNPLMKRSS